MASVSTHDVSDARAVDAPPSRRPWWISALAGVLTMGLAIHLLATAIFVGPDNVAKQELGAQLTGYMEPMFQQEWSLFAPKPISTEYALWVRARRDDGTSTEWVDATGLEVEANILHSLAPSRAGIVSRRVAGLMRGQYRKLTETERDALAADFETDAWARLDERMTAAADHSPPARISYVLRLDRAITAYATQFAWAWWGRDADLTHVQVKIVETKAPRFADRGGAPTEAESVFGLRPLYVYEGQDSTAFAEAIERFRG